RAEPLLVQPLVDLVRAARSGEREESLVVLAPAERAGAVPGRERGRLVEEEQLGEPPRLQQRLPPPAAELEPAGDPALRRRAPANPPVVVMEAAAIAIDEPAGGVGDELAERSDPVLQRHRPGRVSRTTTSGEGSVASC